MPRLLSRLTGLRARVSRGFYVKAGLLLAALKLALDTGVVYAFTHKTWSPLGYIVPSAVLRSEATGSAPEAMHVLLVLLALPFLWIGLSMSVRRAADAGMSPWIGAGFLVPVVNYATILLLCLRGTHAEARWAPELGVYRTPANDEAPSSKVELPSGVRAALLSMLLSVAVGLGMIWLSVFGLGLYGTALFFATPFTMGASTAALYNAKATRRLRDTLGLAVAATILTGCILLLFALEGLLCLMMAMPIALSIALVGAFIGWAIVTSSRAPYTGPAALIVALPALATGEAKLAAPALHDVTTAIEIDAPPERVWPHVIGFSDLPEPPRWVYGMGIAYPMRARIEGEGVGAVRRCEFSTGPFVEPITVWDPPRRLAFDVTSQPPSMTEWSPYAHVNAPHVERYMVSRGGEFRLVALPGGKTRLEGTTHYTLAIYPELYWRGYGEAVLHGIHERVLRHIKGLSEA